MPDSKTSVPAVLPEPGRIGKRKALVMGIDDYPGFQNDLPSCLADAAAMSELLARRYGYEIEILLDKDVTLKSVQEALQRLCHGAQPEDRLFLYYSGHGATVPHRGAMEECLVFSDGTLLLGDDLVAVLKGLPPGIMAMILDACYSGGMAKNYGWPPVKTKGMDVVTSEFSEVIRKGSLYRPFGGAARPAFGNFTPMRKQVLVEGDEAGDAALNALLISACLERETASASTPATGGLSVFTYAVLSVLASRGDGLSCMELVDEATAELRRIGERQTPQIKEPSLPAMLADAQFPVLATVSKSKANGAVNPLRAKLVRPEKTAAHAVDSPAVPAGHPHPAFFALPSIANPAFIRN